ncbi:MAG: hypothetical protein JWP04_2917 [Belnapia sp.]|nr:hypothetical protein [Belnapia sp.]
MTDPVPSIASHCATIRADVLAGRAPSPVEILGAACLTCLTADDSQAGHWDLFRDLARAFLRDGRRNRATGDPAVIAAFLHDTPQQEVVHFRRKDPHVWEVRFHAIRADGRWLACDGRYDSLLLLAGDAGGMLASAGRVRDAAEADQAVTAIVADIAAGWHDQGAGRSPPSLMLFSNGRPIDQSITIARFARVCAEVPVMPQLRVLQNRATAFFDPALLPAIAARGAVEFYAQDGFAPPPGASLMEALYLPDNGWAEHNQAARSLRTSLAPPRPALAEGLEVFISLEFEKRVWVEQAEGLLALFRHIAARVAPLTVHVNGMTGVGFAAENAGISTHFAEVTRREAAVIAGWRAALPGCGFRHLAGLDLTAKLAAIAGCGFAATPGGTAALIACLGGVPGVYYSHPGQHRHFASLLRMYEDGLLIGRDSTRPDTAAQGAFDYSWAGLGGQSYSIPPDAFLAEALARLAELHPGLAP